MDRRNGRMTVDLTGIDRVPIGFRVSPYGDVAALAGAALGNFGPAGFGGTPHQQRAIREALVPSLTTGLGLLLNPVTTGVWEGLMPLSGPTRAAYQRFGEIEPDLDTFCDIMRHEFDGRPPEPWRAALDDPKAFLHAYLQDARAVWASMGPGFDPQPLIDREAERIGSAVVRGTLPEMLASVFPSTRLVGNKLILPMRRNREVRIGRDGFFVGPILTPVRYGAYVTHGSELAALWYPMPGVRQPSENGPGMENTGPDSLAALIGAPRAIILRHLDRAAAAGDLANILHTGPSGVTYHVDALVAAGLVERQRRGRYMFIARTTRGDRLIDLYSL